MLSLDEVNKVEQAWQQLAAFQIEQITAELLWEVGGHAGHKGAHAGHEGMGSGSSVGEYRIGGNGKPGKVIAEDGDRLTLEAYTASGKRYTMIATKTAKVPSKAAIAAAQKLEPKGPATGTGGPKPSEKPREPESELMPQAPKVPAPPSGVAGPVLAQGEAKQLWDEMPEGMRQAAAAAGLKGIKVVSNGEMAKEWGSPLARDSQVSGMINRDTNTILLNRASSHIKGTLHHEVAHAIDRLDDNGRFSVSESRAWRETTGWTKDSKGRWDLKGRERTVSQYAKTAPWEDFAETVRIYTTGDKYDRRAMAADSPRRHAFVKTYLEGLGVNIE